MIDRPILFSGPMARALLDGRKTQTRRVLNPQPPADMGLVGIYAPKLTAVFGYETPDADHKVTLRYMPGDRLYVREAWRVDKTFNDIAPRFLAPMASIHYEADGTATNSIAHLNAMTGKFRQGMHMPRWASRLTLTVTDVRVQQLQEISEEDAIAEGIHVQRLAEWAAQGVYVGEGNKPILMDADDPSVVYMTAADADCGWKTAREAYAELWDDLNEARGYGWDANPWVAAVSFTVERRNIDLVSA